MNTADLPHALLVVHVVSWWINKSVLTTICQWTLQTFPMPFWSSTRSVDESTWSAGTDKVLSSREVIDSYTFYVLTTTKTMSGPTYSRMTTTFRLHAPQLRSYIKSSTK